MEEEYIQFTMRMEKDLYEKLKENAKECRRSVAKHLEYIVASYFVEPPKDKKLFQSAETDALMTRLTELLAQYGGITGSVNSPSKK